MKLVSLFLLLLIALFVIGATSVQAFTSIPEQPCESTYIVQRGDTLREIANACDTTVQNLLANNPQIVNPERIYVGQVIYLAQVQLEEPPPEDPTAQAEPIPVTGDPNAPAQPANQPNVYTVQTGDSLGKIARNLNIPLSTLLLANPAITNANIIHVGQQILIPTDEDLERLKTEYERQREEMQRQIVASVPHNGARWVDVDLAAQLVRAYEGETLVNTFVVSTGTSRTPTVTGQFNIWIKLRTDDMSGPGYYLRDVPYVMYFYKGYGLHGTYWHNNFGTPMSHGCVNLTIEDSEWLYNFAEVGTLVNVH